VETGSGWTAFLSKKRGKKAEPSKKTSRPGSRSRSDTQHCGKRKEGKGVLNLEACSAESKKEARRGKRILFGGRGKEVQELDVIHWPSQHHRGKKQDGTLIQHEKKRRKEATTETCGVFRFAMKKKRGGKGEGVPFAHWLFPKGGKREESTLSSHISLTRKGRDFISPLLPQRGGKEGRKIPSAQKRTRRTGTKYR